MSPIPMLLAELSPVLADLVIEDPVEQNSKRVVGLIAAVAGVVILYLVVRKKRS